MTHTFVICLASWKDRKYLFSSEAVVLSIFGPIFYSFIIMNCFAHCNYFVKAWIKEILKYLMLLNNCISRLLISCSRTNVMFTKPTQIWYLPFVVNKHISSKLNSWQNIWNKAIKSSACWDLLPQNGPRFSEL